MYYDVIQFSPGHSMQLPVRSLVGLIPLYATLVLEPATINRVPGFKKRMEWFIDNRPEVSARNMANMRGMGLSQQPTAATDIFSSSRKRRAQAPCTGGQGSAGQDPGEDAGRGRVPERTWHPIVCLSLSLSDAVAHPVTGCLRNIRTNHGAWMFTATDTRSDTGLAIRCRGCLAETQTGVARYGSL